MGGNHEAFSGYYQGPTKLSPTLLDSSAFWMADCAHNDYYGTPAANRGWHIFGYLTPDASKAPGTKGEFPFYPWHWMATVYKVEGHPQDAANFLFGDGHVRAHTYQDIAALSTDELTAFLGKD